MTDKPEETARFCLARGMKNVSVRPGGQGCLLKNNDLTLHF